MRKTRIAIVGAGLAATPHALALKELSDEVEVVGVLGVVVTVPRKLQATTRGNRRFEETRPRDRYLD